MKYADVEKAMGLADVLKNIKGTNYDLSHSSCYKDRVTVHIEGAYGGERIFVAHKDVVKRMVAEETRTLIGEMEALGVEWDDFAQDVLGIGKS